MDFLELLHEVGKLAKPMHKETIEKIPSLDTPFVKTSYDSLDMIMMVTYVCEIYGISDEVGKEMAAKTPAEMLDFVNKHKTKDPQTVQEAVRGLA